jgi:FKBP-type peptidyl-prolyl cis-trans isomerase
MRGFLNLALVVFTFICCLISCDVVERKNVNPTITTSNNSEVEEVLKKNAIPEDNKSDSSFVDTSLVSFLQDTNVNVKEISNEFNFTEHLKTKSGISIDWIKKLKARKPKKGELLMLEYRLSLPDGKIIDGNNKMKMPYLPFVLGYNMQNKGWDEALSYMSVGDVAQIKIPSALAYGEKGLGTLIPSNSENWLFVKLHGIVTPSIDSLGLKMWELRSGKDKGVGEVSKVKFHMIASTESRANVFNTYTSNFPVTYTPGQRNYPKGLRTVLNKAKIGQHLFIVLDSEMAFGKEGYLDLVRPNEQVFYNLKILEVD